MIKILILGEIIGIPTVKELRKNLKKVIEENAINMVVANADGASDGYGLLADTAYQIHNAGVNVITSGDYIFNKKDMKEFLGKSGFILRPNNLPKDTPGRGYLIYRLNDELPIAVINILGRNNFNKIFATDPFVNLDKILEKVRETAKIILVDFHGGTTSEIQAMQWFLKGKVSAVFGSHLRVLTSDCRILGEHTAVITGAGICGGYYSIGGLSAETEIKKIKTGQFVYSKIESADLYLQGMIITVDEATGKSVSAELINRKING